MISENLVLGLAGLLVGVMAYVYRAGELNRKLKDMEEGFKMQIQSLRETVVGLHRRHNEADAELHALRMDTALMRNELEGKGALREKTKG